MARFDLAAWTPKPPEFEAVAYLGSLQGSGRIEKLTPGIP